MKTIISEQIRPFDVDGCLIVGINESQETVDVYDDVSGDYVKVGVNKAMVRLIREEDYRGSYIIVWSRSGYAWADAVITALQLTSCVDLVISKPLVYFDDQPVENWLKDRVFIGPDVKYKE